MLANIGRALVWFLDGLAEAAVACAGRWRPRPTYALDLSDGGAVLRSPKGKHVKDIGAAGDVRDLAPDLGRQMAQAAIDIVIPARWLFRRSLNPVAKQSVQYLDAFVSHQIDKITPWLATDVYYRVLQAPLPDDASRLSLELVVIPRRVVDAYVEAFRALGATTIRLVARGADRSPDTTIPVVGTTSRRIVRLRGPIKIALAAIAVLYCTALSLVAWEGASVQSENDDLDGRIRDRKSMLATAVQRNQKNVTAARALPGLRAAAPRVVDLIEALSAVLPDSAYLTDLSVEHEKLRLSGVATDPSSLVQVLEASKRFSNVAFFEATTRLESGGGDRFHLEMRAASAPAVAKVK